MKAEGRTSRTPIRESFGDWGNLKRVLITLFGITTGMTVIWYTSQFYALSSCRACCKWITRRAMRYLRSA